MNFQSFSLRQILVLTIASSMSFISCEKNNDTGPGNNVPVELPAERIGTYTGQLAYYNLSSNVAVANDISGKATIEKTGDKTYRITFSDGAPIISNLKFKLVTAGSYATINADGSIAGMTLDSEDLSIAVTTANRNENWAFTGIK